MPQVDSSATAAATLAPPASAAGTETVLLVEDAQALRDLTKLLLERQGYRVLAAANAAEAHHLFELNQEIAALLSDVVMPGCSGPELARAARGTEGGGAFLHKPFTSNILGRKIRETLDN